MSTSTRFEKEANSNSEMAYFGRNQGPPWEKWKRKLMLRYQNKQSIINLETQRELFQ